MMGVRFHHAEGEYGRELYTSIGFLLIWNVPVNLWSYFNWTYDWESECIQCKYEWVMASSAVNSFEPRKKQKPVFLAAATYEPSIWSKKPRARSLFMLLLVDASNKCSFSLMWNSLGTIVEIARALHLHDARSQWAHAPPDAPPTALRMLIILEQRLRFTSSNNA